MLAEQRFAAILEILNRNQAATVAQLCEMTGASESTIRARPGFSGKAGTVK